MKMTKVLLAVLCGMLCIGLLSCASSGGSSGGSAGAEGTAVAANGEWVPKTDDSNGGTSTITLENTEIDGLPAWKVSGETTTGYQYGYTCLMLDPDADTLAALKTAKAVSFKVLGDGKRYTLKFVTTGIHDFAYFEYHFNTVAGKVETINIPIRNFMQPSWGAQVRFRTENATNLEFQTHEVWRPDNYEFTISDVQIYQ